MSTFVTSIDETILDLTVNRVKEFERYQMKRTKNDISRLAKDGDSSSRDNEVTRSRKAKASTNAIQETNIESHPSTDLGSSSSNVSNPLAEAVRAHVTSIQLQQEQEWAQQQQRAIAAATSLPMDRLTSNVGSAQTSLSSANLSLYQPTPLHHNPLIGSNMGQLYGIPLPTSNSNEALTNDLLLRYGGSIAANSIVQNRAVEALQRTEEARLRALQMIHQQRLNRSLPSQLQPYGTLIGDNLNGTDANSQLRQLLAVQEALQHRPSLEILQQQQVLRQQQIPLLSSFQQAGLTNDSSDWQLQQRLQRQHRQLLEESALRNDRNNHVLNLADGTRFNNLTQSSSLIEGVRSPVYASLPGTPAIRPASDLSLANSTNERKMSNRSTTNKSNTRSLPSTEAIAKSHTPKSKKKTPIFEGKFVPDNIRDLSLPSDQDNLSEYQCLLRQQIVLFSVSSPDIQCSAQGRNRPIKLRQVGVLCKHCARIPPGMRPSGSVYFPARLSGLYQASQNMAINHFSKSCQSIPELVRTRLLELKERKSTVLGGGKNFWANGARIIGVVEGDEQLQFVNDDAEPGLDSATNAEK